MGLGTNIGGRCRGNCSRGHCGTRRGACSRLHGLPHQGCTRTGRYGHIGGSPCSSELTPTALDVSRVHCNETPLASSAPLVPKLVTERLRRHHVPPAAVDQLARRALETARLPRAVHEIWSPVLRQPKVASRVSTSISPRFLEELIAGSNPSSSRRPLSHEEAVHDPNSARC